MSCHDMGVLSDRENIVLEDKVRKIVLGSNVSQFKSSRLSFIFLRYDTSMGMRLLNERSFTFLFTLVSCHRVEFNMLFSTSLL